MKRMNMQNIYRIFPFIFLLLTSCRGDEPVPAPREITVSSGFYLLNEGNKGNNWLLSTISTTPIIPII